MEFSCFSTYGTRRVWGIIIWEGMSIVMFFPISKYIFGLVVMLYTQFFSLLSCVSLPFKRESCTSRRSARKEEPTHLTFWALPFLLLISLVRLHRDYFVLLFCNRVYSCKYDFVCLSLTHTPLPSLLPPSPPVLWSSQGLWQSWSHIL